MKTPTAEYLRDFLVELDDVRDFTIDGKDAFMQDVRTQKAVIYSYEAIGDIAHRLPATVRASTPDINWDRLITFRDFLAHNYDAVVLTPVWEAVEDAPRLRAAIKALLAGTDADDEDR